MAFLGQEFNAGDLPQGQGNFEPIPAGWYQVKITEATLKDSAKGGKYINIRFDVLGPTHQGRVLFGMINIQNPSVKAEEIGRQQLGDLMRSIGLGRLQDTDQLIGANVSVKVGIQEASGEYEARNNVKGYKAIEGSAAPAPVQSQAMSAPVEKKTPPWQK